MEQNFVILLCKYVNTIRWLAMSVKYHTCMIFIMVFIFSSKGFTKTTIDDYQNIFIPMYNSKGDFKIAIRSYFTTKELENTRYFKALKTYSSPPYLLQNYGLTHSDSIDGMFLSVDLCPSTRLFERDFFNRLSAIADKHNKKFPVAIAISDLWISNHQEEFNWLINNEKSLDITWINHSFSHPCFKDK